ncbi:hypothetical protein BDQ17DRAFT_151314 [Cyathus striatus]|nr:hypothetical protein BDQ17DRAFT_151314 [Cyathus striatus]
MILSLVFPTKTYWQPFHQAVGKLYVNSVLASLNVRRAINPNGSVTAINTGPEDTMNLEHISSSRCNGANASTHAEDSVFEEGLKTV